MIHKAQITFVAVTMAIILAVFAGIFGGFCYLMENTTVKMATQTLNITVQSYNETPLDPENPKLFPNCLIYIIDTNTVTYDEHAFSEQEIDEILNFVTNAQVTDDIIKDGTFFYTFSIIKDKTAFVAINMEHNISIMHATTNKIFVVIIFIYMLLFLFVWLVSYKVFAPMKKSLKQQKQFISDASHELKTPIAIISANADVIKQSGENPWVDNIKTQTQRLNNLVADMLTLAKMDEQNIALNVEEFNLSDVVTDTLLPFDAVAFEKNKNLILNIQSNIKYKGDKNSVKKIITILADNAIKHATINGEIVIALNYEDKKIVFSVYNSGCEIKDEDTEKIFERFYRGDNSRSRDSGGSGLGLAIAKSIATANKWKISAKSKLHEYMKIILVL